MKGSFFLLLALQGWECWKGNTEMGSCWITISFRLTSLALLWLLRTLFGEGWNLDNWQGSSKWIMGTWRIWSPQCPRTHPITAFLWEKNDNSYSFSVAAITGYPWISFSPFFEIDRTPDYFARSMADQSKYSIFWLPHSSVGLGDEILASGMWVTNATFRRESSPFSLV